MISHLDGMEKGVVVVFFWGGGWYVLLLLLLLLLLFYYFFFSRGIVFFVCFVWLLGRCLTFVGLFGIVLGCCPSFGEVF